MPATKENKTLFLDDKNEILEYIEDKSLSMYEYIEKSDNKFSLWIKNICHSDLINKGKRNGSDKGIEDNLLYYLSVAEMNDIQKQNPNKVFESAKQSNIGLPKKFYEDLGIERLKRRNGKQKEQHQHICLNDFVNVLLVNDTLKYFEKKYTIKVLEKLKKEIKKFENIKKIELNNSIFTDIKLSQAIHGLGISDDKEFSNLRMNIFLNDTLLFLIEHKNNERKNLFVLFNKNPKFFSLVGITDESWVKYLETANRQAKNKIRSQNDNIAEEDEKSRKYQNSWKIKLAEEMKNYSITEGEVFCPLTMLRANFENFKMLFVASHIKRHADCKNNQESFDIDNGLLLSPNADALFDKYMITITENKEIKFSYLLENDAILKNTLLLNQPIFKIILNEKRMENLKYHREKFYELEEKRRGIKKI